MINYITKHTLFDTITHASHTNSLLKQTPPQPVPPELPSIYNGAHFTEKLLLKARVSEDFA